MTQKPNAAPEELPENYCGNTPLMRQYFATRAENASILLLMRVGDFYEAYGPDAVLIAADLQITLTGREDGGTRVPMAGVPYHAVERYLARLIRAGRRVAIMEQMEDPRYAKGLVKRKVTRIVTPGTVLEDSMLEARSNNYLVAAVVGDPVAGIGVVDVSTGEFLATELTGGERETRLLDEIARLGPAEILVPAETPEAVLDAIRRTSDASLQLTGGDRATAPGNSSRQQLLNHFGTTSLRGFGCEEFTAGLDACALVLRYLRETQAAALAHIRNLGTYSTRDYMVLDGAARRHLEITAPMGDGGRAATLIGVMDETLTPMGGRMLRRWLDEPLLDVAAIRRRHAAVNHLARNELLRTEIRRLLRGVGDLERLMSRTSACLADARDLIALHDGLARLPDIGALLADPIEPLLAAQRELLLRPTEAEALIARAIVESPPAGLREGGIIRPGYDAELDRLRTGGQDARIWIANLETTERQRTGIGSLKVGYNAVFGYYIEVTRANLAKVPAEYIRKQTTAGGERYITPELKEYEAHVLGAEEKSVELEALLFASVRDSVARSSEQVLGLARAVAAVDVTACFAEAAVRRRWVMPEVDESESVDIKAGRHPVIEQLAEQGSFIPNDCLMQPDQRMFIITGPNMSGKSSYLRQTALIVLLAQCGSFVPADSARIGIVDRIFTRVGAHDELASGQSTFMVEMNETANILNNATGRSLVVLDEIGRGTSTYDGLSIAWAVAEYLLRVGCKTLFATHYHHLNELAAQNSGVRNYRVAVKEKGDMIIWLHRVVEGGTDRSYGIQVARMAGLPMEAIERAREVLRWLEKSKPGAGSNGAQAPQPAPRRVQLTLFEAEPHPILEEMKALDPGTMTPMEALTQLDIWRRRLLNDDAG